jgi:hypothetical protein
LEGWSAWFQTLEGQSSSVNSVTFPSSKLLLSPSNDLIAIVRDASSGQCLQTLEGHNDSIHSSPSPMIISSSPQLRSIRPSSYRMQAARNASGPAGPIATWLAWSPSPVVPGSSPRLPSISYQKMISSCGMSALATA